MLFNRVHLNYSVILNGPNEICVRKFSSFEYYNMYILHVQHFYGELSGELRKNAEVESKLIFITHG